MPDMGSTKLESAHGGLGYPKKLRKWDIRDSAARLPHTLLRITFAVKVVVIPNLGGMT